MPPTESAANVTLPDFGATLRAGTVAISGKIITASRAEATPPPINSTPRTKCKEQQVSGPKDAANKPKPNVKTVYVRMLKPNFFRAATGWTEALRKSHGSPSRVNNPIK